ncbi:MAG: glycosyltransferase family 4 protein [Methanomassiliicoccales archaeon]|nr:glycosyltransferase family 4 protein [Methanomassiliicoccales archaeon]
MRVGIVTTWFERGGAYVSRNIENALSSQHEVFIYARGGEAYASDDPVWARPNVTWGHNVPYPVPGFIHLSEFKRWLKDNKIDTVIFNEQHWWPPILLCIKMGLRVGTYVDYYTEDTMPLFGCYDFLICNTLRHHKAFEWHSQARYVPWGTDLEVFRPQHRERKPDEPVVFFHSAGMNPPRKGTDLAIRAFSQFEGNARLIIHSQVGVRKALPALTPVIDRLVSLGRLELIERTVGAPGLYSLGDVYVYPSRLDGLGLSVVEALACGLPIITTDAAPMNEFIDPSVGQLVRVSRTYARSDGYYWPKMDCDIDDLTRSMESYVNDPGLVAGQRKAARQKAESHYDWSVNGKGILRILDTCQRLDPAEKSEAIKKAISFEKKRVGIRPAMYNLYGWLINTTIGHS